MATVRIGQFVGEKDLLAWLGSERALRAFKSWENGARPKDSERIKLAAIGASIALEPVFDAAHGRRYLCFVYRNADERKACWSCITEPGA